MRTWEMVAAGDTSDGRLELRRRGESDFLIALDGRVLMNSAARRSEEALANIALEPLAERSGARVLIGGLGMGITLRAALDTLPADAQIVVAELHETILDWCRGPLTTANGHALDDPRVRVELADVAEVVARTRAAERFDAILLDLYEGPHEAARARGEPFYGAAALDRTRAALRPGGCLAVWSEDPDIAFERRLRSAGFSVERRRPGRGGRRHVVYLAIAPV